MTENTCKNCLVWGPYREGECDRVGGIFSQNPAAGFDIVATVLDDSGLSVGLVTGPDFGCVHFFAKEHKNG